MPWISRTSNSEGHPMSGSGPPSPTESAASLQASLPQLQCIFGSTVRPELGGGMPKYAPMARSWLACPLPYYQMYPASPQGFARKRLRVAPLPSSPYKRLDHRECMSVPSARAKQFGTDTSDSQFNFSYFIKES